MKESFAPIIIPTLNRFEHFKRCVETLSKCTEADKTELVIGMDYPPSEKYEEGYKKIMDYLPKITGFGKVTILYADKNLGPSGNLFRLHEYVKSAGYECVISTEDDNEFSPNFLQYMNWGLREFQNDNTIFAICGFKRVDTTSLKNNVYKYPRFNAWGYGQWYDKRDKLNKYRDLSYLKCILDEMPLSCVFTKKVYEGVSIIHMLKEKNVYGDYLPFFLPEDEQYCLFPSVSMVKNHGHDGSGLHGGNSKTFNLYENLTIDDSKEFVPRIVEDLYQPRLKGIYKNTYPIPLKQKVRCVIEFVLYKMTGSVIDHKYKSPWYKFKLRKV